MCNISFCDVDSKVDQFFQPTLYIIVIVLGLPTNCMALWAAYMQVRKTHTHCLIIFIYFFCNDSVLVRGQ